MSEAQIVDVTGGSAVSIYFDYGGGNRRGPFVLWTGGVAGSKVKYANILQQIGTIDTGFTYYGRVGTVEFHTQDGTHTYPGDGADPQRQLFQDLPGFERGGRGDGRLGPG